jgi:CBS domain containing-hemolysin-like protein
MPKAHISIALAILFVFISTGIVFDIVGLAVATAKEEPFHSMASRKIRGAKDAVNLIRNAEKVTNFCNDVVGDIIGIISGSTTAAVVVRLSYLYNYNSIFLSLILTGFVAALTVGGKAVGKAYAISHANRITYSVALFKYFIDTVRMKRRP